MTFLGNIFFIAADRQRSECRVYARCLYLYGFVTARSAAAVGGQPLRPDLKRYIRWSLPAFFPSSEKSRTLCGLSHTPHTRGL